MTEEDYVLVSNLAKARVVQTILLRTIATPPEVVNAALIIESWIDEMERRVLQKRSGKASVHGT